MAKNSVTREVAFGTATIQPVAADVGLAVLRVFAGLAMAIAHGWGKVPPSDGFIGLAGSLGFPLPALFAWAAALSELVGGVLLALGLFTRPAAFFVFMTMMVAGFVHHADDPFSDMELALLFGAVALAFTVLGSGRFGVDRFLR